MFDLVQTPNVLSKEQCAHLIAEHQHGLKPSAVAAPGTNQYVEQQEMRASFSYKLPSLREDIAEKLRSAITEATGASEERTEALELLHYKIGGFFRPHSDWMHPAYYRELLENGGQRTHSVIVYLSSVEEGGETFFPNIGVTITPQPGLLIAWNNVYGGCFIPQSMHEGKPVLAGEKWVLVTWIRELTYKK